jgi:hypothetical protein
MGFSDLTEALLYHIIAYLPENMASIMELVCRSWYDQIKASSTIWESLLDRRGWMTTGTIQSNSTEKQNPSMLRETFGKHCTIVRDMTALQSGFSAIHQEGTVTTVAPQDFSFHRSSTSDKVKSWSANRVLVMSNESDDDDDCVLRLYEAKRGESKSTELLSRSLYCLDISGHNGVLSVHHDLDEHYVYVSYKEWSMFGTSYRVAAIDRNDFTLDLGIYDIPNWKIFDLRKAFFRYILKCDDESDPVIAFIKNGGATKDITFKEKPWIKPCGHGQFLVEVVLATHEMMEDHLTCNRRANHLSWKLCLFSITMGGIVWSVECHPFSSHYSNSKRSLAALCRPSLEDDTRPTCNFVLWDHGSGSVLVGDVYLGGTVKWSFSSLNIRIPASIYDYKIHPRTYLRSTIDSSHMNRQQGKKHLVVTPTDKVVTYQNEGLLLLYFYPVNMDGAINDMCTELFISREFWLFRAPSLVRDDYVALVCRNLYDVFLIVIHVPSRTEICRLQLEEMPELDEGNPFDHIPRIGPDCQNTLGLCLPGAGLVMTGSDVRISKAEVIAPDEEPSSQEVLPVSAKRSATTNDNQNKKMKDAF